MWDQLSDLKDMGDIEKRFLREREKVKQPGEIFNSRGNNREEDLRQEVKDNGDPIEPV